MRKRLHRNFILFTGTPAAFWKTIIFLSNAECCLNCNIANSQPSRWWRKILMQMVWACRGPAQHALPDWLHNEDSNSKWELAVCKNGCVVQEGSQGTGKIWVRTGRAIRLCLHDISKGFLGEAVLRPLGTNSDRHQAWDPWTKAVPQLVRVREPTLRSESHRDNAALLQPGMLLCCTAHTVLQPKHWGVWPVFLFYSIDIWNSANYTKVERMV